MDRIEFVDVILESIRDNLFQIKSNKKKDIATQSFYVGLEINRRIEGLLGKNAKVEAILQLYEDIIFGADKKEYINKVKESNYISDKVELLFLSDRFQKKYDLDLSNFKQQLIDVEWMSRSESNENGLDNVLKLQFYYYFLQCGQKKFVKKDILDDMLLDISNISFWKYDYLRVPKYERKIHNSYHFVNPYYYIYWMSLCQKNCSILTEKDHKVLKNAILDGVRNRLLLSDLSFGLLLLSSGEQQLFERSDLLECMINSYETKGCFDATEFYFNYSEFGDEVVGSELLNAVICLESMLDDGLIIWKKFEKENEEIKQTKQIKPQIQMSDSKNLLNRTICMRMKNHCMEPILNEDDEIMVSFDSTIQIGDIIVFCYYKGNMMAHRVIDIINRDDRHGKVYITAADSGSLYGYPAFQKDIVGKVIKVCKKGGMWIET